MLHPTEQSVISSLNDRLEDLKKVTKQYQKYATESQSEFEGYYKKVEQLTKSYQPQISPCPNDSINLGKYQFNVGSNLNEFFLLFDSISKTTLSQQQEFSQFFNQFVEQYNEKMSIYTRIITDGNFSQSQQLAQSRNNCKKAKEKYEKICKEIEIIINSSKKSQGDALTGYDLNLSQKNDLKLKDLVKQVEPAEQQFKETADHLAQRTKDFEQAIDDSHKKLLEAYKLTRSKFIEVTMKLDQHKLLANNWIKGQMDEKMEKIVSPPKLESEAEDRVISLKYQPDGQFRYTDLMNKIINKQFLNDAEYLQFPEILHKHVDAQLQLINERIKNQKILPIFLIDLSAQFDLTSKGLLKSQKAALQFIQERSDKDKLNFIKPILQIEELLAQHHEGYVKRCNQQSQFIQLKASCLDQIIKDQKNQEKSFMNMYQKMLKDFQSIKQQISENESKQAVKDNLLQQLKKSIQDNSIVIKYSIDQVRANEQQRAQQIVQTIEQILSHYNSFIDDTIKSTKQQEELLNEKFELLNKPDCLPQINIKLEHIEIKFQQQFTITEDIKKKIEDITLLQLQQEDEDCDDKNLEEGSVKVSAKLIEQFRIQDGDKCIASYACAFDNKILLQGRMYIFYSKVCFHSYFNGKTLFGTTALGIPAQDITSIKRAKSYMIDAALEFKTSKGNLIFASLSNRERTILSLKQVKGLEQGIIEEKIDPEPDKNKAQIFTEISLNPSPPLEKPTQQMSPSPKSLVKTQEQGSSKSKAKTAESLIVGNHDQLEPRIEILPKDSKAVIQDMEQISEDQIPQNSQQCLNQTISQIEIENKQERVAPLPSIAINQETIPQSQDLYSQIMLQAKSMRFFSSQNAQKFNTTLKVATKEFLNYFLLDTAYENYISFPYYYQIVLCKDREVEFQQYSPKPLLGQTSKRIIKFIHPVKEKQLFAPDVVHCTAEDTLYYFNDKEILLEKEVKFAKIPYADSFVCRVFWHVYDIDGGCQVNYGFYIHFVKNTVFKGKIESGSKSENTDVWEKCLKFQYEQGQEKIIALRQQNIIPREISQPEIPQKQILIEEKQQLIEVEEKKFENANPMAKIPERIPVQPISEILHREVASSSIDQSEINTKLEKLTSLAYVIIGLLLMNVLLTLAK